MDAEELQELYLWVDSLPLSRPKRNIARDFSDGMLVAEVLKHFFPRLVELHNYPQANSCSQKMINWTTLQQKVFRKLNFEVSQQEITAIVRSEAGAIERFLRAMQTKIVQIQQKKRERDHLSGGGPERPVDAFGGASMPRPDRPPLPAATSSHYDVQGDPREGRDHTRAEVDHRNFRAEGQKT
eukprot:TRINITY_DN10020_c0_g1_i2.p1 TRINITY_DN10020_c0_g1~~TRINITY_DN10020_c0_g1_i2.p1  ORF type:complete len:203 (+),score=46.20 TRINITY_DN10020_c0_g1_i2:61-609(+)